MQFWEVISGHNRSKISAYQMLQGQRELYGIYSVLFHLLNSFSVPINSSLTFISDIHTALIFSDKIRIIELKLMDAST